MGINIAEHIDTKNEAQASVSGMKNRVRAILLDRFRIREALTKCGYTVVALLTICYGAFATSSLKGRIVTEQNNPIAGANILIEEISKGIATDINGYFLISGLEEKTYTLKVSCLGYKPVKKRVEISGEESYILIVMEPYSILTKEIIVSATRAGEKTPVTYTDIDGDEIKRNNMGQDIPVLLNLSPSLVSTSDAGNGVGYTSFRIRGTDATRINITMNGVPLNDAESHGVWWVNMPDIASSIESIQIQRGVGTSTNGAGAFGATINLQTSPLRQEPYAEYSGSAGSFNTFKNTVSAGSGLINNKFTLDTRLSKITSNGFIDRASSDLKSLYISGGLYSKSSILKINVLSGNQKTYLAWNGVPLDSLDKNRTYNPSGKYTGQNGNILYYENETDNYQQDHYQILLSHKVNNNINVNTALHYTYGRGYYEQYKENQKPENYQMSPVDGVETTNLIRQKWLDNSFYGFTLSGNYINSIADISFGGAWNKYDGDHFGNVIWAQHFGDNEHNHEWYRSNGLKTDYNIFGKINYSVTAGLNAYIDMQYRHIDFTIKGIDDNLRDIGQNSTFDFFNPKLGILYTPTGMQKLYFSYAQSHREPSRKNYTDHNPNEAPPTAETLHDFEIGYSIGVSSLTINTNLYYMRYKDQLVPTGRINDIGDAIMTNVDNSYRAGIEIIANWKIHSTLTWEINATLSKNKISSFTEYIDNWDDWGAQIENNLGNTNIALSPESIANSILSWHPTDRININITSQYIGSQFIDNTSDNDKKLDAYFINNLACGYQLTTKTIKEIRLSFMINNIFNVQYESNAWAYSYISEGQKKTDFGYFPQAGTNFMLGANIKF